MDTTTKKQRQPCPRDSANPLSVLFFWWTTRMVQHTRKAEWQLEDICRPPEGNVASELGDRLHRQWDRELKSAAMRGCKPSLHWAIARAFKWDLVVLALQAVLLNCILKLMQPLLLGQLLLYFKPGTGVTLKDAVVYSCGLVVVFLASAFLNSHNNYTSYSVAVRWRAACCSIIYRKALRTSQAALTTTATGKIVNMLSVDVARFEVLTNLIHWVWVCPITAALTIYLMYDSGSLAPMAGVLVSLVSIPLQVVLSRLMLAYRRDIALKTDERVRLMDDFICGIRVIKMYAWEKAYSAIVHAARRLEVSVLRKTVLLRIAMMSLLNVGFRVATYATVLAMYLVDHSIPAEKVFLYTALLSILSNAISLQMTIATLSVVEGYFSIGRLQSFMMQEEYREVKAGTDAVDSTEEPPRAQQEAVVITSLTAKWVPTCPEDTLSNIDLRVTKGQLVIVIGQVGSGKALMGELPSTRERLTVAGKVSYACQDPWVFPTSVRQNILFTQQLHQRRYSEVVRVCALQQDMEELPRGDRTLVGARGVSLSGGQKARLNLARAVYQEADIYLLDDPLSAVDTHVGLHLFRECICSFLSGTTRILVTHQLQYLEDADHIVVMNNGRIEVQGSYQELLASEVDYGRMVGVDSRGAASLDLDEEQSDQQDADLPSKGAVEEDGEDAGSLAGSVAPPPELLEGSSKGMAGGLVGVQFLRLGAGWCGVFLLASSFILLQGAFSACDYWVSYWVSVEETRTRDGYQVLVPSNGTEVLEQEVELAGLLSGRTCFYIYTVFVGCMLVMVTLRSVAFIHTSVRSAEALHDSMFRGVINTWTRFFDINPPGRILNRFAKDLGNIDETLQKSLFDASQVLLLLTGNILVITALNQISLVAFIVLGTVSLLVRRYYLKTSNNLKMLDGISKSPVFSHLHSTLQGLSCIRAAGAQQIMCSEFDEHQDAHSAASYCYGAVNSAFSFVVDMLCVGYTASILAIFLLQDDTRASDAGLIIAQLISTSLYLQWGIKQSAVLSNMMTSVERAIEYTRLPEEPNASSGIKPPDDWPSEGKIEFEHVFLRYAENLPHVLLDLTVTIAPKQKVGIVGRTGAGKSSLVSSLLRTARIQGSIRIDGVDTGEVSLQDLRGRLSVIPQDPVLFSGTLRSNLDPFGRFSDGELWAVLHQVGLKDLSGHMLGLETAVREGGANMSVGQRQLVCLARVILRSSSILLLDEATANVDTRTDEIIQTTIREQFAECTVLTVAHRLATIMDYDRVMVIDHGRLVEWDEPHVLLQNKEGLFYQLVQRTGPAMAEQLSHIAAQKHASGFSQSTRL